MMGVGRRGGTQFVATRVAVYGVLAERETRPQ